MDAARKNAIPPRSQSVSYTSFQRPSTITENSYQASFIYDLAGSRKKMQLKYNGNVQLERYYLGDRYEADYKSTLDKQILYIGGDAYSAPAAYVKQGSSWALYYICRDYLGSITHVINSSGAVVQENSFDAWGRLRDPATRIAYLPGQEPTLFLGRGYTGHEHLLQFGLVNMNARLYDPAIGRFLSPDPFVQMPDFSQNFNRYSYCLNNPLVYVDEDGELFWFIVGGAAIIGAITNVATHWKEIKAIGGWKGFWKGTGYFVVGGVAAGAGAAAGVAAAVGFGGMMSVTAAQMAAASTGFIPGATIGAAGGATSGFVLNTGNGLVDGDRFGGALQSGLMGGLTGGIFGGLSGGLIGGPGVTWT
ncbi:MAG: RHS repeat domain-containing protein [Parabacteroides sp.]